MSGTLLLVDDEEGIRNVLGITLMDAGYTVHAASGVDEALVLFERHRPDIIITDIKMPGRTGIDLLRLVKERDKEVEVIMLTGHGDLDLAIRSIQLDATDFLTKPVNNEMLEFSLRRAGERIRMRRELCEYAAEMQRKVQEELRRTRERYQRLFDASPSYVAVLDRDMRVVEANRRFRDDFGEPGGQRCHELYLHRESVCPDCPAMRTFEDGLIHQHETVVTAADGRQVNVLVVTAPLRDAEDKITEVMEMSADITELRSLQDHLSQLGLLLGSTAHGIKGLLTALDGSIYRMGSGLKMNKPERVEDGFKDMRLLVGKLRKLVLDILRYSKNRELARENVPLDAFARETASLVAGKAEEQGVRLTCDFGGTEGVFFAADVGAVSSALVNILENAVEACAGNPAPPAEGGEVVFRAAAGPDEVCFTVSDNGPGMDRETREKLFTLFFSSKGSAGTGIGLFTASQMVRQHGGAISVNSEPGAGATFTVTLPRRAPQDARSNAEDA